MIELTEQQVDSLSGAETPPPRVLNPRTQETFVLLRVEEYERLKNEDEYDDSPWTREEIESHNWQMGESKGWNGMDEYDNLPEKP